MVILRNKVVEFILDIMAVRRLLEVFDMKVMN